MIINPYRFSAGGGSGYLLDDYGTGVAVAYSLRVLSSSFASSDLIEVREDGGDTTDTFTAAQITDGTLATFCGANNGFVKTWYDQSGNANDQIQTDTAKQPQIVTAGVVNLIGGFPSVTYDGSNDEMTCATYSGDHSSHTGFFVGNSSADGYRNILEHSDNSSMTGREVAFGQITPRYWGTVSNNRFNSRGEDVTGLNPYLGEVIYVSGGNIDTWTDGVYRDAGAAGAYENCVGTNLHLGSPYYKWSGGCQEVILYSTDASANRTSIESEINAHYSIY